MACNCEKNRDEAVAAVLQALAERDEARAEAEGLAQRVFAANGERTQFSERARKAEAENVRLRATLTRVEELVDDRKYADLNDALHPPIRDGM